jgi:hypothetical protein
VIDDDPLADHYERRREATLERLRADADPDELHIAARELAHHTGYVKPAKLRHLLLDAYGVSDDTHPQRQAAELIIKREFREVADMLGNAQSRRDEAAAREARRIRLLEDEQDRRAARREANRLEAEEGAIGQEPVDVDTLAAMLKRPDDQHWRLEGMLPADGRGVLIAQRKTGKTTLMGNLAASLVTGEPFLGRFPVEAVAGTVMVANYEMSGATQARWLGDLGLDKKDMRRIVIVNLRGRENLLASDTGRARFAALMREHGAEVLLVDTFGRAFNGDDQSSNSQVGPWLNMLDRVATDGGVKEVVLTVHAGWGNGERGQTTQVRARGASALEDWPDAIWRLSRDGDARFLEAEGRDVFSRATASTTTTRPGGCH